MSWSYIQGSANYSGASSNSYTLTLGQAVGTHDLVAGMAQSEANGSTPIGDWSITDSNSANYIVVDTIWDFPGISNFCSYYYPSGAGATSITTSNSGGDSSFNALLYDEFSGNNNAPSILDGHAIAISTSAGSTLTASSGNTSPAPITNGDLIYGAIFLSHGNTLVTTAGSGFTLEVNNPNSSQAASEFQVQTTAAAVAATFSVSGSQSGWTYVTAVMAFMPLQVDTQGIRIFRVNPPPWR